MDHAVFINYRGDDSNSYGALLYTDLVDHFGEEHVFLDAESIPAGADFVSELLDRVRSARVLLAVIGPRWLSATNCAGQRRIDDPNDWIHRELAEAFTANIRVIPVLTDGAEPPTTAELPPDIAALSRCQYRHLRRREPTAGLARIVADLTNLDPVLAAAARSRDNAPRQLPAAPGLFAGRATELATLSTAATTAPESGATVVICAIGGAGGVGKTALALHWAYQQLHRFPDGQLYVNLRGFDPSGQPASARDAVRGFLVGLGVDPATLSEDLDVQVARYRSLVAGRRMLIILDNSIDVDQVTPLLPGSPNCAVLITSRRQLTGLTLYGARLLDLDVLPESDARTLLANHLGAQRLAAEPEAVAELLAMCEGLPLAIAIVAARAQHHPDFPLAVLAEDLRDASTRLVGFDAGNPHANLRAVLFWSVRTLSPSAARLFGLLGIAPGPDIGVPAAASLIDKPDGQVQVLLRELEQASLVKQHQPGRYRMHDLIRLYATTTVHEELAEDVRKLALGRVADFYIHTAYNGHLVLTPRASYRRSIPLDPPTPGTETLAFSDVATALAWFDAEYPCLLAVHDYALRHGWHQAVWNVAWTLAPFHYWRGHTHDQLAVWQSVLAVADHLPESEARIMAHRLIGDAYAGLEQHDQAIKHLRQALSLAEGHRNPIQEAAVHSTFAWAWNHLGESQRALEHATHALNLFRTLNDSVSEARTLGGMGYMAADIDDYNSARTYCRAALALHRRHEDTEGEAGTLDSLGYLDYRTGHHNEAVHHYRQSIALYTDSGNLYEVAEVLDRLGHPYAALGQYDQVNAVWRESIALYQQQGRTEDAARIQRQLDSLGMPERDVAVAE